MKDKEFEMAAANGVTANRVVVAVDGLSVITNSSNPVNKLTVDQIGAIYRGEITNWSEVGGPNMPIALYGRQSNSGTYAFMQEDILKGDYSSKMNQMNGNAQIIEALKTDRSGIGYVGVGYLKEATGVTIVDVAAKTGGKYYSPLDQEAVDSGAYPIARPLNQYIDGKPSPEVMEFLKFEVSPRGQEIVAEEGFFPLTDAYKSFNAKAGL